MNKTIQSPVFVLSMKGKYQSEDIWFCVDDFSRWMLPSWTGPLPKRIRFNVTPSADGEWHWSGIFLRGRNVRRSLLVTNSLSDWLDKHAPERGRFNLEMEIIEP